MKKEEYIIDGFSFNTEAEVKIALEEQERIQQLEEKLNYDNLEAVALVYTKSIQNNLFETPVGYAYLKKIQEFLVQNGYTKINFKEFPIKVFSDYSRVKNDSDENEKRQVQIRVKGQNRIREKLRFSLIVNVALLFVILVMFVITLIGENVNIINYKNKIVNQYAEWEQNLTERENVIREKERHLQTQ